MNVSKLESSVMFTTTRGHVSFARFLPEYPRKPYCGGRLELDEPVCRGRRRITHRKAAFLLVLWQSTPPFAVAKKTEKLVFRWCSSQKDTAAAKLCGLLADIRSAVIANALLPYDIAAETAVIFFNAERFGAVGGRDRICTAPVSVPLLTLAKKAYRQRPCRRMDEPR